MSDTASKKSETPRGTHYMHDPDDLIIVGLDTPDGPEHPLYDPRIGIPLDAARVNNFLMYGVIKPVRIMKDGKRCYVVDGRQRVRYAREAKKLQITRGEETIKVPCMVSTGDSAHLFGVSRAANLHNADGPMTNARNAGKLLDMGKSIGEVATTFGVTEQTVRNWQATLGLAPEVIEAMIRDEISQTAAIQMATLPKADQVAVLSEVKEEQRATGKKATVENVKAKVNDKTGKASNSPKDKLKRASNVLLKFAVKSASEKTKEEMVATLERVCRLLTGAGLDKLAASDEE